MFRRRFAVAAALFFAASFFITASAPGFAQSYPTQTIKIIVSFGPGGGSDIIGRIVAQKLQERLGQSVVVENRPGAGGVLGNEAVANAPKDGYTLGIQTAGQIISATTMKQMRYDPVEAFDWIGQIATAGLLIVSRPDYPHKDIKSLVAAAKAAPGKIVFASPGFGATQQFAAELFKQVAQVDMLHVPYRTSPEALSSLLAKNVDVLFDTITALFGQVNSGQVTALAVTGRDRFPALPQVPAAIESGVLPDYDVTTWYGLYGPKGLPKPIVERLNKMLNDILREPDVRDRLTSTGVVVKSSTSEAFHKFMTSEYVKWSKVRETAGIEQH